MADEFSARLVAPDGTTYDLAGEQTLGRSSEADIAIADPKISRKHARFTVANQTLMVEDLGSSNGTRVNQRKITAATTLSNGDTVSFDTVDLRVEITGAAEIAGDDEATVVLSADDDATVVNVPDTAPAPQDAPAGEAVPRSWVDEGTGEDTRVLSTEDAAAAASLMVEVASKSDKPHLVVLPDSGGEQVVELEATDGEDSWEIGREERCDICLDIDGVSGRHAQLQHSGGRWQLVNLMSTNGFYVNGKKSLKAYLSDDDKLRMGLATLVFKGGDSAAPRQAKASAGPASAGNDDKSSSALVIGVVAAILVVAGAAYFFLG